MAVGDNLNNARQGAQELREEFEATRDILREVGKSMGRTQGCY